MRTHLLFGAMALIVVLGTALGRGGDQVSAAGDCSASVTSLADPLTAAVWQSIMDTRAQSGEAPFTWSASLAQAAAWMAQDAASRGDVASDVDSLGRTIAMRDTDCGYVAGAQVMESLSRDGPYINDPFNAWTIWRQGDVSRLYAILYSPVLYPPTYTVGALGRYRNSNGIDYWVLNVGTLADSGTTPPTPTPVPPTATPIPPSPTETSVPFVPSLTPTSAPPADWTWCVGEGGFCGWVDGTRPVRYGADGIYVQRLLTGGIACTNDVFGDPAFGVAKHCDVGVLTAWTPTPVTPTATAVVGAPSPTWTPCTAPKGRRCR